LAIEFDKALLERACKEIIETILFCLPNAYKGTVYRIGKPPEMIAERITSGIISSDRKAISWGLPQKSDYNPPGKPWSEYRDQEGRPLEAMAWCVERQKSWTSEDPKNDMRSVRLQVEGVWEDYHHMEPVLLRKENLYLGNGPELVLPRNAKGEVLWKDRDYVVVAVIKIHFRPNTIRIGSHETRIIKKLSRSLGTELLSYQMKQQSVEAMEQVAADKLKSCNILADSIRNAITKSGRIFSLIKVELMTLRERWESMLLEDSEVCDMRRRAVDVLNGALREMDGNAGTLGHELTEAHNRFLSLFLPPEPGEKWIRMKIEERWDALLAENPMEPEAAEQIRTAISDLRRCLSLGQDPELVGRCGAGPEALKQEWIDLIYHDAETLDFPFLERLIRFLQDSPLNLPNQQTSRKRLVYLKTLAQIMDQLEENTNVVLRQMLESLDEETLNGVFTKGAA
jgi:hypothetical protein